MTGAATHGHTRGRQTTGEFNTWVAMRARCSDPNNDRFAQYGARGIKVCDRWNASFDAFIADMGLKPSRAFTIEREDRDGDYEPSNCRWASQIEQANNKSNNRIVSWDGCDRTVAEWARHCGMTYSCLQARLDRGWPIGLALNPKATRRDRMAAEGRIKNHTNPKQIGCAECGVVIAAKRKWRFCRAKCRISYTKRAAVLRMTDSDRLSVLERRRARYAVAKEIES